LTADTPRFRAGDRPVGLPHLEAAGDELRLLGEPIAPDVADVRDLALLTSCDGSRRWDSFSAADRRRMERWHAEGLVLAAPQTTPADPGPPVLVVSPHPDDAVLALGGLLTRSAAHSVNAFSVETWTHRPYYAARPALAGRLLLEEERVASRIIGVTSDFLGFVDAADRPAWRDGFLITDPMNVTGIVQEPALFARLMDRIEGECEGYATVYAPLGVGGHIDHLICREVVLELVRQRRLDAVRLAFYEDLPYANFTDPVKVAGRLSDRLFSMGERRLSPTHFTLSNEEIDTKREALRVYRLQLREGIIRRVLRYGRSLGNGLGPAERVWSGHGRRIAADTSRDGYRILESQ
jgi:LmbE family N-acetylglucosaminyl deacetylase